MNAAQLRLSATRGFGLKMTISNVFSSGFSDLPFTIASLFAKPQDSHLAGYIFYFLKPLEFCTLHQEYCVALTLGYDVY